MDNAASPEIYIEVEQTRGAVVPQASADKFVRATRETLQQVGGIIEQSCLALVVRVGDLAQKPHEMAIEFGVNVAAEGGVPFITKGSVGANFKVSVKWKWD